MHYRMNNSNDYGHLRVRSNIVRLRGSQILSRVYLIHKQYDNAHNSLLSTQLRTTAPTPDVRLPVLALPPQGPGRLVPAPAPPQWRGSAQHADRNIY